MLYVQILDGLGGVRILNEIPSGLLLDVCDLDADWLFVKVFEFDVADVFCF